MIRPNDMCTASYYGDIAKIKELMSVPEVDEEPAPPEDFDPASQPEELEEADPQEVEEALERAAQRAKNTESIQKLLATSDVLVTRLSPVDTRRYGLHLFVTEDNYVCSSRFKTSLKSSLAATPLHWAVLGRSHNAIEFLVSQGADIDAACPLLKVSPLDIAKANKSFETLNIINQAKDQYEQGVQSKADAVAAKDKLLADRAAAVLEHRRQVEEEERLASEREAAELDEGNEPNDDIPDEDDEEQ
eukprot:GILI01022946.1.p1 GENE.GILI01022946.1~~GILI01022946.1.p1  ORF type:complete len:246 (-),score=51.34 GILI01022946.1:70-807(-)